MPMTKKKCGAFFISILIALLWFSGCTDNNGQSMDELYEPFIGMWNTSTPIAWHIKPSFIFYENFRFNVDSYLGNVTVNETVLSLEWDNDGKIIQYHYEFLDKNTLSLTVLGSGDNGIYSRQ